MKNQIKHSPVFIPLRFGAAMILILVALNGCYHYNVHAPNFDPATEYQKKTAHSLFWGLAQKDVSAENCVASHGIDEVRVTTNLGYAIITIATLGIWCPMTVEWKCAKPCQPDDEL